MVPGVLLDLSIQACGRVNKSNTGSLKGDVSLDVMVNIEDGIGFFLLLFRDR